MATPPKATGRKVREYNNEALAMINEAKKHTVAMREALYAILERDDVPSEAQLLVLSALRHSDKAVTAADSALYYMVQNDMLLTAAAKRGKYNK